jgi:hypothetical protein
MMAFNYAHSIQYIQSCYNCLVIPNERKKKIEVNLCVNNSLKHTQVLDIEKKKNSNSTRNLCFFRFYSEVIKIETHSYQTTIISRSIEKEF